MEARGLRTIWSGPCFGCWPAAVVFVEAEFMLSFSAALIVMTLGLPKPEPVEALELRWSAPPECPAAADVRADVRALVADAEDPQPTTITATVSLAESGRWALELDVDNVLVSGRRTLEAESCADLAHATAMIAAIAIDPFAGTQQTEPKAPETPETRVPPTEPAPPPDPAPPTPQPDDPPAFTEFWSVGGAGGVGWSAGRTGAVRLSGGWERRRLGVRFGSDIWLPRRYDVGEAGLGLSVTHALAHLRVCGLPGSKTVTVLLCGGARVGASIARGFGVREPATRGSLASAALASVGIRWTPGRTSPNLGLFFDAESALHLTRPRFHTADRPPAYIGNGVALLLLAGAEVRFGVRD